MFYSCHQAWAGVAATMRCVLSVRCLVLSVVAAVCAAGQEYVNTVAVHITGGAHQANRVARDTGMINKGQVSQYLVVLLEMLRCLWFYVGTTLTSTDPSGPFTVVPYTKIRT